MNIEQLLSQVSAINKRYAEIAKISGENFNIFNVLNLSFDELSHSRVIATLLNPNGEHGMGIVFLKHFLETIHVGKCRKFDCLGAEVEREKEIEGGRLDILISAKSKKIIIENKINARDQDEQLQRYHNYDKSAVLLYLTLDGHPATSAVGLKPGEDYHCISYRDDILTWLEMCRKEAVNVPFPRETISQYILLVKQLTRQTRRDEMNTEILDAITVNAETLTAAWAINGLTRSAVLRHIVENKTIPDLKKMASNNGLDFEETKDNDNIFSNEYGFRFSNKERWGNISIWFAFGQNLSGLGSCVYDFENKEYLTNIWEESPKMKYNNWDCDNSETVAQLCSHDNEVIKEIEKILKEELIPKVEELVRKQ